MKTITTLMLAAAFLLTRPAFAVAANEAPKAEKKDEKKAEKKKEEKKEEKKAEKGGW